MQHRMIRGLAMALAAFATAALARTERPLVGPAPDWVQQAAEVILPVSSTDAPVQILLSDQQRLISPQAVDTYYDSRVRIQTPQGLQAIGTIALAWQPDADVVTVHRLVVRRGAQVRDLLGDGSGFTILRREDLLEQATLTGRLTAVLQPSDLQVGDIVEFAYTHRHTDPVVPDKPDLQVAWPNAPIQTVRFRATWPKPMRIRWQLRDFKPTLQESANGGSQSISFTLDNPPPLLQPVGAPPRYAALRRIELSAFQTWPDVSRRLAPLYDAAAKLAADSQLHAEVTRIHDASHDPKERAAAALRLVQQQVRYVLLAMDQGALVPATADQTWQRRYGDCKAKTALLLALLRELGIDAVPVAVNSVTGDGIEKLLPGISAFNHVLIRATINGRAYWLDGTRPADQQLDHLEVPAFSWGLPLDTHGSELVRIEPAPLTDPQLVQEMALDASTGVDGPIPFKVNAVFRGDAALALKLSYDNLDPTQRDQALRNYWRGRFDRLQLNKVAAAYDETANTMTWTAEGTLSMEWDSGGFYEIDDMRLGFKADFTRPEGADADAPYAVAYPVYTASRVTLKLPAGAQFTVSGTDIDETLAGWHYKRSAHLADSVFTAESSSRSLIPEISSKDAHAAEAGLREIYKNVLYLKKPRELPSAEALRSQAGRPLDTAKAYVDRGFDMMNRSMFELAIAEFTSALKLDPNNAIAYADRGLSNFNLGRFDEVGEDLRRALDLDPKNAIALRGLGAMEQHAGHSAQAINLLTQSLQIDESAWARDQRVTAYLAAHDVANASQDLIKLSRTPIDAQYYFGRHAIELMQQNRVDDVRTLARAALDAHLGAADGVVIAAALHQISGASSEARHLLDGAIAKTPSAELFTQRAYTSTNPDLIIADFEQALKLDPKYVPALQQLSALQVAIHRYPDALRTLDRLEAAGASVYSTPLMRGDAQAHLGQTEAARASYAAARAKAKGQASALNSLCWSEATTGVALDDALKDCDAALAETPGVPAFVDSRGLVLLKLRRYEEAIASYDAAITKAPKQATSLYGRGIAKLRLGKRTEGEADIAAARDIESNIESRFADYGVRR